MPEMPGFGLLLPLGATIAGWGGKDGWGLLEISRGTAPSVVR
jgi:hypothetical protein